MYIQIRITYELCGIHEKNELIIRYNIFTSFFVPGGYRCVVPNFYFIYSPVCILLIYFYSETLLNNVRDGRYFVEIDLEDLRNDRPKLHQAVLSHPNDYIPVVRNFFLLRGNSTTANSVEDRGRTNHEVEIQSIEFDTLRSLDSHP